MMDDITNTEGINTNIRTGTWIPTITEEIKTELGRWKVASKNGELRRKDKFAFEQKIFETLKANSPKCERCPRTEGLTLDHIVSQYLLAQFGVDISREVIPNNYRLLCRPCNQFKSDRLDMSDPRTKEVLLFVIDKYCL